MVRTLPPATAQQLFLSQVLLLTRLRDPTARARVADAAVNSDWSVKQLEDAITAVRAGLPLDGDPDEPGVQVPQVEAAKPKAVPGRLVTRVEKLAAEVQAWSETWPEVDASRLRKAQRVRLAAAADLLEAQVVELRRVIAVNLGA